jgi:hypothetical protein
MAGLTQNSPPVRFRKRSHCGVCVPRTGRRVWFHRGGRRVWFHRMALFSPISPGKSGRSGDRENSETNENGVIHAQLLSPSSWLELPPRTTLERFRSRHHGGTQIHLLVLATFFDRNRDRTIRIWPQHERSEHVHLQSDSAEPPETRSAFEYANRRCSGPDVNARGRSPQPRHSTKLRPEEG